MTNLESFLPYGQQSISESDIAAVVDVLRSPYLTQGPVVPAFERAVADQVGAKNAVAVNSATSALHLACLALGLGPGDRLWTSPITFVASANCARYCGAMVDFVDIDPATGLMSVAALAAKLEQAELDNTLPKVVVPVHLCGTSCDMALIAALADRYGFAVLEDASHAIGGSYHGEAVGNCRYSTICVFSFHPVKIITTAEGGLATTNDFEIAQRMLNLRSHGITKDPQRFQFPSPGPWSYEQQDLGFNYRMSDVQAALGLSQLKRLREIVNERNSLLNRYKTYMRDLPIEFLSIPINVVSSVHLAVIRLNKIDASYHLKVFCGMRNQNVGVQLHYSPVHLQPYYKKLGFNVGDFIEAEVYGANAMSLPLFPGLNDEDLLRVRNALVFALNDTKEINL